MLAPRLSYSVSQTDAVRCAKQPLTKTVAIQLVKSFLAKGASLSYLSPCSVALQKLTMSVQAGSPSTRPLASPCRRARWSSSRRTCARRSLKTPRTTTTMRPTRGTAPSSTATTASRS